MESTYWVSYFYRTKEGFGFGYVSTTIDKKLSTQVMLDITETIKKGFEEGTTIIILSATKMEE